jgi:membrane protease YdiL (CAAX protease family)
MRKTLNCLNSERKNIMQQLTNWIKRHQIAAFFVITFAITWGLGFSYDALKDPGKFLLIPIGFIATCGPALAGIIVTAVSNTQPRQGTSKAQWIAFLGALIVSTIVFLAHNTIVNHAPLSIVLVGFILISVIPVAFVISATYSRIPAVKSYLVSLIRLRGILGWALLALVLLPGLALLSIPINSIIGRQPITTHQFPATGLALIGLIAVKFLYQLFFFNATGEEVGWRGFALPRLQARTSPLIASLVLTLFWAPWHFFLWQAEGKPVLTWQYWLEEYVILIPATFIIVWLYNRSKGSILVAGIAHAAGNTVFAFLPNLDGQVLIVTNFVAALVLVVMDRMWKKLPPDNPAVYKSPQLAAQPSAELTPIIAP